MTSETGVVGCMAIDVIVVGAGVAGLCAALDAAPRRVLLLCPGPPDTTSASAMAQGGIAAPLGAGDSVAAHVSDTLRAACHSADPATVESVVGEATSAIRFLESCGVAFDAQDRQLCLHREAGHGMARVAHAAGDRSGAAIVAALWERVRVAPHIRVACGFSVQELIVAGADGVFGVRVCGPDGSLASLACSDVVLATGGVGHLFKDTTNGEYASGDGLAMALSAGARTAGLEFVQFHPTALRVEADPLPLLTEALRGAGARLCTASGEWVMEGRHPLADLAPRDTVARAVWEHSAGNGRVFLDARQIFAGPLGAAFPGARETALRYGVDPARQMLPVTVAAHYHMGGILVDPSGRSSVPGLWACGEVAYTGLHGANRLASNSLLEAVVCGRAVGSTLAGAAPRPMSSSTRGALTGEDGAAAATTGDAEARWNGLRQRMSAAMGPVRSAEPLLRALQETRAELAVLEPSEVVLRGRFTLAAAMMSAALEREESRGAHWRTDFRERDATRDGAWALHGQPAGTSTRTRVPCPRPGEREPVIVGI